MKKQIIFIVIIVLALAFAYSVFKFDMIKNSAPSNSNYSDKIIVTNPIPESVISSPLKINGSARGGWYFEASFPVILTNWDGLIIAEGFATAKDDWMTNEFVPFEGVLNFTKPDIIGDFAKRGSLILKKDNPSGLPENDDALEFTVYFE